MDGFHLAQHTQEQVLSNGWSRGGGGVGDDFENQDSAGVLKRRQKIDRVCYSFKAARNTVGDPGGSKLKGCSEADRYGNDSSWQRPHFLGHTGWLWVPFSHSRPVARNLGLGVIPQGRALACTSDMVLTTVSTLLLGYGWVCGHSICHWYPIPSVRALLPRSNCATSVPQAADTISCFVDV